MGTRDCSRTLRLGVRRARPPARLVCNACLTCCCCSSPPHPPPASQYLSANAENEQLWHALAHVHASLHVAVGAQQVARAAAVAVPRPPGGAVVQEESPDVLLGQLFSPSEWMGGGGGGPRHCVC